MKRVYVAGPYSADKIVKSLHHMRKGMRVSTEVALAGYAPFCPWLDYHFILMLRDGEELSLEWFYQYSLAWLKVSDAVLVLPNYKDSKGTLMEIENAVEWGIPVFYDMGGLTSEI